MNKDPWSRIPDRKQEEGWKEGWEKGFHRCVHWPWYQTSKPVEGVEKWFFPQKIQQVIPIQCLEQCQHPRDVPNKYANHPLSQCADQSIFPLIPQKEFRYRDRPGWKSGGTGIRKLPPSRQAMLHLCSRAKKLTERFSAPAGGLSIGVANFKALAR